MARKAFQYAKFKNGRYFMENYLSVSDITEFAYTQKIHNNLKTTWNEILQLKGKNAEGRAKGYADKVFSRLMDIVVEDCVQNDVIFETPYKLFHFKVAENKRGVTKFTAFLTEQGMYYSRFVPWHTRMIKRFYPIIKKHIKLGKYYTDYNIDVDLDKVKQRRINKSAKYKSLKTN